MSQYNHKSDNDNSSDSDASSQRDAQHYILKLYVTGHAPNSIKAIAAVRSICETHLQGRYELQVIDVYQQPLRVETEQIMVVPALIKELPLPPCKIVGDLTDVDKVLSQIGLKETKP